MQVSPGKLTSEEGYKEYLERDVEWMLRKRQKHWKTEIFSRSKGCQLLMLYWGAKYSNFSLVLCSKRIPNPTVLAEGKVTLLQVLIAVLNLKQQWKILDNGASVRSQTDMWCHYGPIPFRSLCPTNGVSVLSQYLQEAGPVRDTSAANAYTSSEATVDLDGLSQYADIRAS